MDIARPDLRQIKRRHQITTAGAAVLLLVAVTAAMSRLKPAVPSVERGSIWTDTVKRGSILRQVRGLGTLVPRQEDVRLIPAESEATVLRILKLPGSHVKSDTILLEMSNLQLEQEALDTELQLKAAEAEYQNLQVKLESDLMNEKSSAATVGADYNQAKRQAEADKALYEQGVISALAYKASQGKAGELSTRNDLEAERLTINQKAIHSQMDVQRAKIEQMHPWPNSNGDSSTICK
jgi:HlyD family secretion protein